MFVFFSFMSARYQIQIGTKDTCPVSRQNITMPFDHVNVLDLCLTFSLETVSFYSIWFKQYLLINFTYSYIYTTRAFDTYCANIRKVILNFDLHRQAHVHLVLFYQQGADCKISYDLWNNLQITEGDGSGYFCLTPGPQAMILNTLIRLLPSFIIRTVRLMNGPWSARRFFLYVSKKDIVLNVCFFFFVFLKKDCLCSTLLVFYRSKVISIISHWTTFISFCPRYQTLLHLYGSKLLTDL